MSWLLFCAAIIAFTTLYGQPHNSLHTSAQQWAFISILATLAGLGFPTLLDAIKAKNETAR